MKKIVTGKEAREKLLEGVKLMHDCVVTTLSPKGRNVALARSWGFPNVVHDGVTVAREVMHADEFVNMGVMLIKEAAAQTNTEAGDGTTTATLLAYHLVAKGLKEIDTGINPMVLRRELENLVPLIREEIKKLATPVKSTEDIKRIAAISSGDEFIGKLVADAVEKIGKDGLMTVEEGKGLNTTVEYTEGVEFNRGYAAPHFITNPERMEAVIQKPAVVVFNKELTMQTEIVPLLEAVASENKNILVVGKVKGQALEVLVQNKMRGIINAVAVDPPSYGDTQTYMLEDLAIATGGKVIPDEFLGMDKERFAREFDLAWVGKAESAVITKDSTTVIRVDDEDIQADIDARIKQLKHYRVGLTEFERENADLRIANLATGAAVFKVGVKNEVEMREKIERVKDAVGAARSAQDEGIVAGGGITFLKLAEALPDNTSGAKLLRSVLIEPIRKILENAGESDIEKTVREIMKAGGNRGYEVMSGEIVDLIKAGIIDPAMVVRLALENAIAVAGTILTTDVLIAEVQEKKENG